MKVIYVSDIQCKGYLVKIKETCGDELIKKVKGIAEIYVDKLFTLIVSSFRALTLFIAVIFLFNILNEEITNL